jgi:hypothetical protein
MICITSAVSTKIHEVIPYRFDQENLFFFLADGMPRGILMIKKTPEFKEFKGEHVFILPF